MFAKLEALHLQHVRTWPTAHSQQGPGPFPHALPQTTAAGQCMGIWIQRCAWPTKQQRRSIWAVWTRGRTAWACARVVIRSQAVPPPWFTAPPPADRDGAESHRETSRQRRAGTRGPELSDQAHSNVLNCGLSSWRRRRALTQRLLPTAAAEPHRVHRKPGASEQQFAHTELACQPVRLGGERSFHARQAVVIRVPLPCHWAACVALWRSHCQVSCGT